MCFSGPVIYTQYPEIMPNDDITVGRINWIEESISTKQEFIYKKHDISFLYLQFVRLIFFGIILSEFYYLPNPTPLFTRMLKLPKEKIENHYFLTCLLLTNFFTLFTIIYNKISLKEKHCLNIFVLMSFLIFLIIYAVWEIIYLTDI